MWLFHLKIQTFFLQFWIYVSQFKLEEKKKKNLNCDYFLFCGVVKNPEIQYSEKVRIMSLYLATLTFFFRFFSIIFFIWQFLILKHNM